MLCFCRKQFLDGQVECAVCHRQSFRSTLNGASRSTANGALPPHCIHCGPPRHAAALPACVPYQARAPSGTPPPLHPWQVQDIEQQQQREAQRELARWDERWHLRSRPLAELRALAALLVLDNHPGPESAAACVCPRQFYPLLLAQMCHCQCRSALALAPPTCGDLDTPELALPMLQSGYCFPVAVLYQSAELLAVPLVLIFDF